ncbi:MAG TPA: HAMP domain-containing sensor histidine kinase [Gemmatimonadaceae bacterium]|nr:HAMP domain-containing sensor histidine kinase [Gemmatimonadaceae bacterium]
MSLRLRLALWYGGLTGVIVTLVCVYSYLVHSRTHYDEMDRVLASAAEHVAEEVEAAAPGEQGSVLAASLHLGTAIRLFDATGRVTRQSAPADSLPDFDPLAVLSDTAPERPGSVVGLLSPLDEPIHGDGAFGLVVDSAGDRWRVYVRRLANGTGVLAAAQPLGHLDSSVRGFGRLMVLMAVMGAFIAFAVGWLLSSHALRPVAVLTESAGAIARSREFSRRVPTSTTRDELGRLARTFNEMLASLAGAYAAQQRFVSDASHELRAPLTVIRANLELLRNAPSLAPDERGRAVEEAHGEAERLSRLVADLLVLARADAGIQIRRERVELDRVLMDVIGDARHLAHGHRLEVASIEPILLDGDPDRLKQLLLIPIDNAIRYTPPCGRVTITLHRRRGHAEVRVSDSGIGIAAEAMSHVFERFYRADPARARDPGGTGLGLGIARWIATQHGGTIDVASEPGRGTTVVIRLPTVA